MKLTENTKVRIRVPKDLYESIQAELGKMEGKEMEMEEADSQQASVEEIAAAMDKAVSFAKKLAQQIADKKGGSLTQKDFFRLIDNFRSKVKDFGPFKSIDRSEYMEEAEEVNEYVGMSPDQAELVNNLGQLIIGGGLAGSALMAAKTLISFLKDKAADKAPSPESEPMAEELEEVLDFETLMEAVKDASKKKVEDKKKKEAESKKKKAEDDKKKVEDKKKKEADAKKKAEAAKKK